jgi:hypothetical protein
MENYENQKGMPEAVCMMLGRCGFIFHRDREASFKKRMDLKDE